jgi:hypothetical protein
LRGRPGRRLASGGRELIGFLLRSSALAAIIASISASSQAILWSLNCIGAGNLPTLYQSSHMIATVGDPLLGTELGESDESHAVSSEAERFCTVWGI